MQTASARHLLLVISALFQGFLLFTHVNAQAPCYRYSEFIDPDLMQRATISLRDSLLDVAGNIRADYRVIGYSKPDVCSKREIIFSVFTNDVKGNPYNCSFGAFYSTSGDAYNDIKIRFAGETKFFIKTNIYVGEQNRGVLYFERRWVRFTKD
jgi:hypothetical protein